MKYRKKYYLLYFIMGLFTGIIVGWFISDTVPVVNKIRSGLFSSGRNASQPALSATKDEGIGHIRNSKKSILTENNSILTDDRYTYTNSDNNLKTDTLINEIIPPAKDSVAKKNAVGDIVIMKDEILYSMYFPVINRKEENELNIDSLLLGETDPKPKKDKYLVEFWRSPVNYQGYKMAHQKIIVYGLVEFDSVKLVCNDNCLYLRYVDEFYRLRETLEYNRFVPITNPSLINELKEIK